MKVALISRGTLFTVPGGDTVQVQQTAEQLRKQGLETDVILETRGIATKKYDLLHFFNITRPADILRFTNKTFIPYVITPIWIDYTAYDKYNRRGFAGTVLKLLPAGQIEYVKTIGRYINKGDRFPGWNYLVKGQEKSIRDILAGAKLLLTNGDAEYELLSSLFGKLPPKHNVTLGIDPFLFRDNGEEKKEKELVICAGRIEGIKNQLQLIRAINQTRYQLLLIGDAAPNQQSYLQACKREAGSRVSFIPRLPQEELLKYYQRAKVHALPGWYESCGLASLEAAAMGCNIVITKNGFASSYFHDNAFYCDPASVESIRDAIETAMQEEVNPRLKDLVRSVYTWQRAGEQTLEAYKKIMPA
jgi:glycosyltransferase involved in cell wall biosynthesis